MRVCRVLFLAAAAVQVAGLFLDRRLVPYAGTAAMAALLLLAFDGPHPNRWSRRTHLTGLALLAVTAALVDARSDGYGWPAAFGDGSPRSALLEGSLLSLGLVALAVREVWGRAMAGLLPLLVLALGPLPAVEPPPPPLDSDYSWSVRTDLPEITGDGWVEPDGSHAISELPEPVVPILPVVPVMPVTPVMPVVPVVPIVPEPTDIATVSGPPVWEPSLWEGGTDWPRSWPALYAALVLLGLLTVVSRPGSGR